MAFCVTDCRTNLAMYFRLKQRVFLIIGVFVPLSLAAQHNNAWFRTTVRLPLDKKLFVDAEFQHRRQNGLGNRNLCDQHLMFTYRAWLHYQYNPSVKFSVSPFAYFSNYKIIQQKKDEQERPIGEFRYAIASEIQKSLPRKTFVIYRIGLEYRSFQTSKDLRSRSRIGFQYQLSQKIKAAVYDELFLSLNNTAAGLYDHNRVALVCEYKLSAHLTLDFGYIYIHRRVVKNKSSLKENNMTISLIYKLGC